MQSIPFQSATELAAAIRNKELSSSELLELYLGRVEALNPSLNAVVTLDEERATRRAKEADEASARGESWGPLHGLPMTVKDTFETAGMRTTSGAEEYSEHVPTTDAVAVARLRAAGAVIFGKTNMPTLGADFQSFNPVFGCTKNPWDLERTPGGSSGGSAAALAAGLTSLELGSDIAGSIRTPAHFCGVYGLKPTHGIIPFLGHIPGPPGTLADLDLAVVGPMGRSPADLDLCLMAIAGPEPARSAAWRLDLPAPTRQTLEGLRVAAWLDDPYCAVDADVLAPLENLARSLEGAGAKVDRQARPVELSEADRLYTALLGAAGADSLSDEEFDAMCGLADGVPPREGDQLGLVRAFTQRVRTWNVTNEERQQMRARWATFFEDFDVLICPPSPTPAFPHAHDPDMGERPLLVNGEDRDYMDTAVWAGLITMALLPSVSAPIGRTSAGLPVGAQIVAPYLCDRTAIAVAEQIATLTGGFTPPPGVDSAP